MIYSYVIALHIIFVVTWFAGMFYMPRLFIYNTEANERDEISRKILHEQLSIMMKRLWYGITVPSAVITIILGPYLMFANNWHKVLLQDAGRWLLIKLVFVLFLYIYFFSLHVILKQQLRGVFKYSSNQLRMWNEVATIFLFAIVFLAVVKTSLSWLSGLIGLVVLIILLLLGINLYRRMRKK